MSQARRVIILTDGDDTAYRALEEACHDLHCHAVRGGSRDGSALIDAIHNAPKDPVVVMVDDRGDAGQGPGEKALKHLLQDSDLNILGVVAVASNTPAVKGVGITASVNQSGEVVDTAVDKAGHELSSRTLRGDTVDVLADFEGPIIGLGDPGKMQGHDAIKDGVPATRRAIEEILRKAGEGHATSPV